jgi:outer membrane protein TolC
MTSARASFPPNYATTNHLTSPPAVEFAINDRVRSSFHYVSWTIFASLLFLVMGLESSSAQTMLPETLQVEPPSALVQPETSGPPVPITLDDAIRLAQKNDAQYLSAVTAAKLAQQDSVQARAALLPSLSYSQQYLGTQGNGTTPNGRFVTNDGVHVYRVWGVVHQDIPAGFFTLSPYKRARAAAAIARAQAEIARRGLVVTVTRAFYGLLAAQQKYATAQRSVRQAEDFVDTTKQLEAGGEVAHSDVIKAQLQLDQQKVVVEDAALAMDDAHLALGVLLSRTFNQHFTAIANLDEVPAISGFKDVEAMAMKANPVLRAALEAVRQAQAEVTIARNGFFPTVTLDGVYGIEANELALHSPIAAAPQLGALPNLGYFVTASLNMPIWNWGATLSKLRQAKYRRQQTQVELSQAQRETLSNLYSYYNGAVTARSELATQRDAADLAQQSVQLTNLRYRAGEATALEVVDAQNALAAALNALADGQARYRESLATLQTLTGPF